MPSGARSSASPEAPPVLLPYQQRLLACRDNVVVYEKSRRIGVSWTAACAAVTTSAASRAASGADTLYIGYNLEMAREFIDDCAFWARHLAAFAGSTPEIEEFVFREDDPNGERSIQAFRIRFASGYEIVALSSRPRSLRGKQGFVVIDEAAFHEDLQGLMKAAMAMLIWGGRVWIVSTHNGADNPFNDLVEDVRAGRRPYTIFRTTFREAVSEGLYRRICLRLGKPWSAENERGWVESIYAEYGDDAAEELDVIPAQGSGVWLPRATIVQCMQHGCELVHLALPDGFVHEPESYRREYVESWFEAEVAPRIARLDPGLRTFAGGDFGRSGHLTVISLGQSGGGTLSVPLMVELRNCPFAEQRWLLFSVLDAVPRFAGGAFDARGLGAQISEETMQRYGAGRILEVKAGREWYRTVMPRLKAMFEDRTIRLPDDEDVVADLRAIRIDKGVPIVPETQYRSLRGGFRHADAAVSLALLLFATETAAGPIEFHAAGGRRASVTAFEDGTGFDLDGMGARRGSRALSLAALREYGL